MRDHDAALDQGIAGVADILGEALVRLLFVNQAIRPVDFPETESPHVSAG